MRDSRVNEVDIFGILERLPHRYPFLLIDRVIDWEPGVSITGIKNVTINEPFFQGHFPARPVMPGVLILEALAQAGGVLGILSNPQWLNDDSMYFFVGIDKARFKRPVGPGDQVLLEVEVGKVRRNIWVFKGEASVDKRLVACAELMCTYRSTREVQP